MAYLITQYLHFLGILTLFATCLLEHRLLAPTLSRSDIRRLMRIDILLGIEALVVLLSGLSLTLWLAKPLDYYLGNGVFHLKYTLFILIGLISAYPTQFFLRHRKGDPEQQIAVPAAVRRVIRLELAGILCLPLLALLMANGYGMIK
ncbi:DUF2214 family protein [Sedimenticola sp.]|uniref:DUF2214 family protein n=1 Tax=Sedimenticola sp. TaxID=1940285 RepID=UPI003D11A5AA